MSPNHTLTYPHYYANLSHMTQKVCLIGIGRPRDNFLITPKGQRTTKVSLSSKLEKAEFQLLNLNLDNENVLLTFDLLGLSQTVIPFFN